MTEELQVFQDVTGRLARAGIDYMVTGSIATSFYAVPRMTRDIDVVVELTPDDVDRILGLLGDDFYVDRDTVPAAVRDRGMFNAIHIAHVVKVDFVVRKDSEYRLEEFARRRRVAFQDTELVIVTPEDLILSKLDWARETRSPIPLADVRNLLMSVQELDRGYVERWARRLGLEALYREVAQ